MFKRWAIAFSLANLCFFKAWRELLNPKTFYYLYFWKQYPIYLSLVSLVLWVALLTLLFFCGFKLAWRFGGPTVKTFARGLFLVIFLRALNSVRVQFDSLSTHHIRELFGKAGYIAIGVTLLVLLVFITARYGLIRVARITSIVVLVLSPFGLVGLAQATLMGVRYHRLLHDDQPAESLPPNANGQPRVLWLIFDELNEEKVFSNRPDSLKLPNFDRLGKETLSASNAFPPAGHTTQSIPALLTGQLIAAVRPAGPDELMLTLPSQSTAVYWSRQPDIFTAARAAGFNTGVVGWYHPYCRVVGDRLTSCVWQPASNVIDPDRLSLARNMRRLLVDLLAMAPFTGSSRDWLLNRKTEDYRTGHLAAYQTLVAGAIGAASDPNLGLTFIHLPVPHAPYIYDRQSGVWDTKDERQYFDNVALADRALGELRQAMERAGTWDHTTIVISSDHWWRTDYWRPSRQFWSEADNLNEGERVDHRVPFIVKLAGQKTSASYDAAFNTVLTHDMILDVMNGKISTPSELQAWLDTHKTIGESPYQNYDDP
jgi:hypothetical protein